MKNTPSFFDFEEEKILSRSDDLHKALTHLRYEGKLLRNENIKAVQISAYGLDQAIESHSRLQEEVIFPFLQTHIPRHEVAIAIFETEHEEIKKQQEKLKETVLNIYNLPDPLQEGKVYEIGICLVTLIRHHIGFEKRNIGRTMLKELRPDEKAVIHKKIKEWCDENRDQGAVYAKAAAERNH